MSCVLRTNPRDTRDASVVKSVTPLILQSHVSSITAPVDVSNIL